MEIRLTQDEIILLCRKLGFRPRPAKIASAIALCEAPLYSAETPTANFGLIGDQDLADNVWGYSYGGFQIRSLRAQKGTGGLRDEERLLNPAFNTLSALFIKRAFGWNSWSTYKSGMYKAYLQDLFPPECGTYIVLAGDTLSSIATKHNTTVSILSLLNGVAAPYYTIYIGQVIHLPND